MPGFQTADGEDVNASEGMYSIHTRARKSWFAASAQLDKTRNTDFGTLVYLPWELREAILTQLDRLEFDECFGLSFGGWEFRPQDPSLLVTTYSKENIQTIRVRRDFEGTSAVYKFYHLRFSKKLDHVNAISNLRKVSKCLKQEFDSVFLGAHNFIFDSPEIFTKFIGSPSMLQAQHGTRMLITIFASPLESGQRTCKRTWEKVQCPHFVHSSMESWYTAFDCLPLNLKLLDLDFYYNETDLFELAHNRRRGHVHDLDMLLNKMRRRAPSAKKVVRLKSFYDRYMTRADAEYSKSAFTVMTDCVKDLVVDDELLSILRL